MRIKFVIVIDTLKKCGDSDLPRWVEKLRGQIKEREGAKGGLREDKNVVSGEGEGEINSVAGEETVEVIAGGDGGHSNEDEGSVADVESTSDILPYEGRIGQTYVKKTQFFSFLSIYFAKLWYDSGSETLNCFYYVLCLPILVLFCGNASHMLECKEAKKIIGGITGSETFMSENKEELMTIFTVSHSSVYGGVCERPKGNGLLFNCLTP